VLIIGKSPIDNIIALSNVFRRWSGRPHGCCETQGARRQRPDRR
jgi:hypothetical protein